MKTSGICELAVFENAAEVAFAVLTVFSRLQSKEWRKKILPV